MKSGYYIFLGNGDYHCPNTKDKKWVHSWYLSDWKKFILELKDLNINTLMLYLNGHKLPYSSTLYPQLIDIDHPNVLTNFLPELLSFIREQGIQIVAVITTTGHAGGFAEYNPQSKIEVPLYETSYEDTLISFPEHLRQGKSSKKIGAAQVGFGVLCHNKTSSQKYALDIIEEIIGKYGSYFDGVALHPPESLNPCLCISCCTLFKKQYELNLKGVPFHAQRKFFILSYMRFQEEILIPKISSIQPFKDLYTFTVPWLFESSYSEVIKYIPPSVTIIEWDYNLNKDRVMSISERIKKYKELGNRVIFMPTAGFSFNFQSNIDEQISLVHEQIRLAKDEEVNGIIHFLGPKSSDYLVETGLQAMEQSVVLRI